MKKIVVVGSSNTDMIINVPRIPQPGETVLGGTFSMAAGGKGANQAVAAARAGGEVAFVARVGNDTFGGQALANFAAAGIDTSFVQKDKAEPSGIAEIFVDANGENSIAVAPGANNKLSPQDVRNAARLIVAADMLVLQLESPLESVITAAELAAQNGVKVILNPAPACDLPQAILQHIAFLTPNESETHYLTGVAVNDESSAEQAANILIDKGIEKVIITRGVAGSYIATNEFRGSVPAYPVAAVDTTAAGDVFNGALAVALTENRNLPEAVRFANAAAAISVTRHGAQPSAPLRSEIDAFLS